MYMHVVNFFISHDNMINFNYSSNHSLVYYRKCETIHQQMCTLCLLCTN